jgi:hypothetical protein
MHLPKGLPETACELRIRLTSGSDPTSFDDGTDLIQREASGFYPLFISPATLDTLVFARNCSVMDLSRLRCFPSAIVSGLD